MTSPSATEPSMDEALLLAADMVKAHYSSHREYKVAAALLRLSAGGADADLMDALRRFQDARACHAWDSQRMVDAANVVSEAYRAALRLSPLPNAAPQAAAVIPQGQPDDLIPAAAAPELRFIRRGAEEMTQELRDALEALILWFDQSEHREGCGFGQVVQSGPMEGNKLPCTCGLIDLQDKLKNTRFSYD